MRAMACNCLWLEVNLHADNIRVQRSLPCVSAGDVDTGTGDGCEFAKPFLLKRLETVEVLGENP